MLKSQITKGHHVTPVKRTGKAFPDTEAGRALLLAYAVSQLGIEQKASLQIDLIGTTDKFDYELAYSLLDATHISMPERISSFCVVNGMIIVPTSLPRTVRNYIRMDVRLGYLDFRLMHSTTDAADFTGFPPSFPDLSEPLPDEAPDAVVSPKYKEAMEDQIKKLREKYPSKTEEEIRQGLENWVK